jgi:hypothetical protein
MQFDLLAFCLPISSPLFWRQNGKINAPREKRARARLHGRQQLAAVSNDGTALPLRGRDVAVQGPGGMDNSSSRWRAVTARHCLSEGATWPCEGPAAWTTAARGGER